MPAAFTNTPSVQTLDFEDIGPLIRCVRLCGSCSSGPRFAMGFLPTNTSRCRSCPSARPSSCKAVNRLTCSFLLLMFTVQQVRPAGRTKEKSRGLSSAALKCFEGSLARLGRRLGGFVHRDVGTERQRDPEFLVARPARARRNQVTHDDVFLEALQVVHLAKRRGVGEDACRLLEGGGGDEALGLERSLGDAQQDRLGLGGFAAGGVDALVLAQERHAVDLLAPEPL